MEKFEDFRKRYEYDVEGDHLGDGGSGNVFRAYDKVEDRYVALKIVHYKNSEIDKYSLESEVRIASSINDKTNIAVYDKCFRFLSDTGIVDVALMQFYKAGNLKKYLTYNNITQQTKIQLARGIINGLSHIHGNKIIHRDLKPENILIVTRPGGQVVPKIADFGISKKSDNIEHSSFSHSLVAGTIAYSSPEQLKEDTDSLNFNTDLWSLGVIIYEIFIGENPFVQNIDKKISKEEKRKIILKKIRVPELPSDINNIPQPYKEIIENCIVVDPVKRIRSINEIRKIIDQYLELNGLQDELVDDISDPEEDNPIIKDKKGTPNEFTEIHQRSWIKKYRYIIALSLIGSAIVFWALFLRVGTTNPLQQVSSPTNPDTSFMKPADTPTTGNQLPAAAPEYMQADWYRKYLVQESNMRLEEKRKDWVAALSAAERAEQLLKADAVEEKKYIGTKKLAFTKEIRSIQNDQVGIQQRYAKYDTSAAYPGYKRLLGNLVITIEKSSDKYGAINAKGEIAIAFDYERCNYINSSKAIFYKNSVPYIFDGSGKKTN